MSTLQIRAATTDDFARILQLNDAEVQHTSAMDLERLRYLDQLAFYHRVATVDRQVAAFLFAMRDGAAYANDNFNWFAARLQSFLYIDRIVVAKEFAGQKIGSAMYGDLFTFARSQGIDSVVCEYNVEPPNLPSQTFHAKWGFSEIGSQWLNNGSKRVSLQQARLGQ